MQWTKEETSFLVDRYINTSNKELSILLNKSLRCIERKLCYMKLKRASRLDGLNECFFDTWSIDMAYILGYTMADGCIYSSEYRFGYGVSSKDRCILEYIGNQFNYSNIIDTVEYRKGVPHNTSRLRISSKYMVQSLEQYNIVPRKTGREQLPNIPIEYKSHYLRGLFDGDGSISVSNKKTGQLTWQIASASDEFLDRIKIELCNNYGYIRKDKSCYKYNIYKQSHIQDIKNQMYKDASFCLLRKKDKFKK